MNTYKVIVFCYNSNGCPDVYPVKVNCEKKDFDDGEHYLLALNEAYDAGFRGYFKRGMVVIDNTDNLFSHFDFENKVNWDLAPTTAV